MVKKKILLSLMLLIGSLLSGGSPVGATAAKPPGIETLFYSQGRMEQTFANHMNASFAKSGDYVPTMVRRRDANCLTAVNWQSHDLAARNAVIVMELWDAVEGKYKTFRCQVSDWQMQRDSTGSRQRFEVDYVTAKAVHMIPQNTTAKYDYTISYPTSSPNKPLPPVKPPPTPTTPKPPSQRGVGKCTLVRLVLAHLR